MFVSPVDRRGGGRRRGRRGVQGGARGAGGGGRRRRHGRRDGRDARAARPTGAHRLLARQDQAGARRPRSVLTLAYSSITVLTSSY